MPVRFRTLGCYPLTGAVESEAATIAEIIEEMLRATHAPSAQGRLIDQRQRGLDGEEEAARAISDGATSSGASAPTTDIDAYLERAPAQEPAALHHLRLGRRRQVDADRPAALRFKRSSTTSSPRSSRLEARHAGGDIDFALLVDGLAAEREQGITIDVAYRYFATDKRKFIVADTPGHEQYTRNMVTGASTADLAVVLVDARKGVLTQTRRHAYLARCSASASFVLAVNKMDLVGYDQAAFDAIVEEYRRLRASDRHRRRSPPSRSRRWRATTSPSRSARMPWYRRPDACWSYLETVELDAAPMPRRPFRMPVQWVNRPNRDFRGFAGADRRRRASGRATRCSVLPRPGPRTVARIVDDGRRSRPGGAGQSVALTLRPTRSIARAATCIAPPTAAGGRRPVRGDAHLDGGGAAAARPPISAEARHRRPSPPPSSEPKYKMDVDTHGAAGGAHAGAERDRRRQSVAPPGRSCSSLMTQSRDARRLHPDRPGDQRHGRRRA